MTPYPSAIHCCTIFGIVDDSLPIINTLLHYVSIGIVDDSLPISITLLHYLRENRPKHTASKVFHFFLPVGCTGIWDAVLQIWKFSTSRLRPTHFNNSILLLNLLLLISRKRRIKELLRLGGMSYIITACLYTTL